MYIKGGNVKKPDKEQNDDTLRRPTAVDLLKRLWKAHTAAKPAEDPDTLQAKTDIYSVPSTRRRITPQVRPVK